MSGQTTPQVVQAILEWQWTWPVARFALVVFYLGSGLSKIADFSGAVAEMVDARLPAPAAMALLSIFIELTGSVLVLIDRWVWLGAGMLGVFTAVGAVTAHAFWTMSVRPRVEAITVFLMHLGLIAAFVLCALVAEREGRAAQVSAASTSPKAQVVGVTLGRFQFQAFLELNIIYIMRSRWAMFHLPDSPALEAAKWRDDDG